MDLALLRCLFCNRSENFPSRLGDICKYLVFPISCLKPKWSQFFIRRDKEKQQIVVTLKKLQSVLCFCLKKWVRWWTSFLLIDGSMNRLTIPALIGRSWSIVGILQRFSTLSVDWQCRGYVQVVGKMWWGCGRWLTSELGTRIFKELSNIQVFCFF